MSIDWFTVVAQAVNFVLLVWLLKRFLYKPILGAIDAREQWIATELADAEAKEAEAQKEKVEFQRQNEVLQQRSAALLTQATTEANAERQRLVEEARQVADALSAKRQETLTKEAQDLNEALGRRTEQEVFGIARQTLADLASASLDERIADAFVRRLKALDASARARLADALRAGADRGTVRSAFDLPAEQRTAIQQALEELLSAKLPLHFEVAPTLIGGVELTVGGQRVSWNIAAYLSSLQQGVANLLQESAAAAAISAGTKDKRS